jgi:hypothetical protein
VAAVLLTWSFEKLARQRIREGTAGRGAKQPLMPT